MMWISVEEEMKLAGKNWIELGWFTQDECWLEEICWRLMLQQEQRGLSECYYRTFLYCIVCCHTLLMTMQSSVIQTAIMESGVEYSQ